MRAGRGPLREMHSDITRRQFIVAGFPSLGKLESIIDEAENQNICHLRENSTTDYIWTKYDLRLAWIGRLRPGLARRSPLPFLPGNDLGCFRITFVSRCHDLHAVFVEYIQDVLVQRRV